MNKRLMIVLVGLALVIGATTGSVFALTGDGDGNPELDNTDVPSPSAMCVEEVPDCNDTLVIGPDEEDTIEPDFGEDGRYLVPDRDIACGPDQGVAITTDGQVSCLDLGKPGQSDDGEDMVSPPVPPTIVPAPQ